MTTWQVFLLGMMVAYLPALIFLAIALSRATDQRLSRGKSPENKI